MELSTPISELEWIAAPHARKLEKFGLRTAGDLLTHFPHRYEDRRKFDRFPAEESDKPVCVCGTVIKVAVKRLPGWKKMVEVLLEEEDSHALSPSLTCRWFNMHFIEKMIATGQRLVVYGKPKLRAKKIIIDHPEFEIVENDEDVSIHLKRITPIHSATEGIPPRLLRGIIYRTLEKMDDRQIPTRLPKKLDAMPLAEALRQIHFPESDEAYERARRHLALDEFFAMQLFVVAKRAESVARAGESHCGPGELMERLHAGLPFPLTGAQKRVIAEIREDLASAHPMNRLLHGDVGSGKTLVALSAMLLAVESGSQAALMAPTQILAEQHYLNFKRLLEPMGLTVALRTGSRKEDSGGMELFERAGGGKNAPLATAEDVSGVSDSCAVLRNEAGVIYSKRNLPHFERPWAKYAITFSTKGRKILSPDARRTVLDAVRHFHGTRYELYVACVMPDHVHLLIEPQIKETDADGNSVFYSLSEILHSIKSYTSHEVNKPEEKKILAWEKESFDRLIRSEADFEEKFEYIARNPWDAGVVGTEESYEWLWMAGDAFRRDAEKHTRDACAPRTQARGDAVSEDGTGEEGVKSSEVFSAGRRKLHASRVRYPEELRAALVPELWRGVSPHIIVGTHALIYENERNAFEKLGLVVIDEQHKFGVMQRAKLMKQGVAPDVLVMTATPIPRTLTMTIYGDLDVSTLDEMPANRGKIITAVRDETKLTEITKFIREHLEKGRQAYIVYPLIDESEKLEVKAATREFQKWSELLAPMKCELLHGRVDAGEKEAIMGRFRKGESKALIATTVIEVGVDVPNANIMLIENAERFGLAQLHQLRGRIGRGEHKSYCILISDDKKNEGALEKLKVLERTGDGFEIAEEDLKMRGPGDILGTAQSGLPPLKIGNLLMDGELIRLARQEAVAIFKADPHLQRPENQYFRDLIAEGRKLVLSQVS